MSTPFHEQVVTSLAPIVETLNLIASEAVTGAEEAASGLDLPRTALYHPTRVHIARAVMRHRLEEAELHDWKVNKLQRMNTPVRLHSEGFDLRFLHTTSFIPAPGANKARRQWYSNPPLIEQEGLFSTPERLLALWSADFASGEVAIRVVHPIGTWKHGEKAKIDLSIPLDDTSFFVDTPFDTMDDEEDIIMPSEIEAAEEQEEGTGGFSS